MALEGTIRVCVIGGKPSLEIDLPGGSYAQVEAFRTAWQQATSGAGQVVLNIDGQRTRLERKSRAERGADGVFLQAQKAHKDLLTSADGAAQQFGYRRGS